MNNPLKKFNEMQEEFKETMSLHRELFANALKMLANYGWYISEKLQMNQLTDLVKLAHNEEEEDLNNFFLGYYSEHISDNVNSLTVRFPERKEMFEEAFKAHNNKLYHSSTLLWLTLCDGICEGELFKLKGNKRAIRKWLEDNDTPDTYAKYLEVITEVNAIDAYTGHKANYKSQLNRHGIVHGYDINYGNEINSLKAFSLLVFIKDMVNRHKRMI
jgi:hypothetical protein